MLTYSVRKVSCADIERAVIIYRAVMYSAESNRRKCPGRSGACGTDVTPFWIASTELGGKSSPVISRKLEPKKID